jgi:EAL domain-containing protein (putative c-di-GMP-specific phosphodiesterase class I)
MLERLLRPNALSAVFQPVYSLGSHRIQYVEGLVRGRPGSNFESPDVLFEYARRKHAQSEVDRASLNAVLRAATALPEDWPIGINVHAATLTASPDFPEFLRRALATVGRDPRSLVVEIVEYGRPYDFAALSYVLAELRAEGIRIAVDDIGRGDANFMMIVECRPHIFKMDRYFIEGVDADPHRRAVVESVRALAHRFGAVMVAEGVETEAELHTLRTLGVDFAQGFWLARPAPAWELARMRAAWAQVEAASRPSAGSAQSDEGAEGDRRAESRSRQDVTQEVAAQEHARGGDH